MSRAILGRVPGKARMRVLAAWALCLMLGACAAPPDAISPTPVPSPTRVAAVAETPPPLVAATPNPTSLLAGICGAVSPTGQASDGATMLITLSIGGASGTQYRLDYQFESGGGAHPLDIDGRIAGTLAWLRGTQFPADSGTPNAITLREWTLRRATSCSPLSIVDPTPSLFTLPQGCAFVGSPVSTADQTDWKVDCGAAANRDARGTLAPAFARGGWTSCGTGLATALWANSRFLLAVSESSGAAGEYPRLTQRLRTTSACP